MLQKTQVDMMTRIKFEDGEVKTVDITTMPFIPNHSYDKIKSLLATPEQETVEILHSYSAYYCRGKKIKSTNHISWNKTEANKYPVIYHVNKDESLSIAWSSDNTKGHYKIPKLVWIPNGQGSGYYLDLEGKYALSCFAVGWVDDVENLKKIYQVFHKEEFKQLMSATTITFCGVDKKIISMFRKDFWKEFV